MTQSERTITRSPAGPGRPVMPAALPVAGAILLPGARPSYPCDVATAAAAAHRPRRDHP